MHVCAALNCGNNSSRIAEIAFFTFPSDVERCKMWAINTRRADLDSKTPEQLHKNYVLCSDHFEDSQFTNILHRRLNWCAVPTLFNVPNPPPKIDLTRPLRFDCTRKLRRMKEIVSTHQAKQSVTLKDVHSVDLSVETECNNTLCMTTETDSNVEKLAAAPLLSVDQQSSVPVEIVPHDTPVKKQKTECEANAATTETSLPVMKATAPLKVLRLPVTFAAPQASAIRIVKLMPKSLLQSQLNTMNCKRVMFKTSGINTQPIRLIRPVQAILAAPAMRMFKAMPGITAQGTHQTDSSPRMACRSFKQTEHQNAAITSTQTGSSVNEATVAISNIVQQASVSRAIKPPETPAEKKLKQRIRQMYSQLWRKNRKIEALKRKATEKPAKPRQSVEAILESAKHFLTPLQLSLLRAQLLNSQREKSGYRWSTCDKIFGLQLMYKSAAAFRFVSQHLTLPTHSTLRRFVAETLGSQDSEVTAESIIPPTDLETDDNHLESASTTVVSMCS